MIKKTLCFNNPAYLSLRDNQLVIKLPEVEKADNLTVDFKKSTEVTRPIEDIGVLVLSHAPDSRWIHHVSILYLCTALCQYGKRRGTQKTDKSYFARVWQSWYHVHHR